MCLAANINCGGINEKKKNKLMYLCFGMMQDLKTKKNCKKDENIQYTII